MAFNTASTASSISLLPYFCILLFCMKIGLASAGGGHITYSALKGHRDRQLFGLPRLSGPTQEECEVDMSKLNLKPLLRLCRPPLYPAKGCCHGFRLVACRYYKHINNMNTDCASSLFASIGQKGSYPIGLFYSKCRRFGNDKGLSCKGYH